MMTPEIQWLPMPVAAASARSADECLDERVVRSPLLTRRRRSSLSYDALHGRYKRRSDSHARAWSDALSDVIDR
jgi:hypothetical protein